MILTLKQSGKTVTGTGSWAAAAWIISGQYERPSIALNLVPDAGGQLEPGQATTLTGVAVNGERLDLGGTVFYLSH